MKTYPSHHTLTIWTFLWGIIRPYRWWYILILQAPIVSAFYLFANNYSLKLLIDAFSIETTTNYSHLLYPIGLFIVAQVLLETAWRILNFAVWKTQPFVRRKLLLSIYDYVQYHSYNYFQNTPSGTIISKIKGISDGYNSIFENLTYKAVKNLCVVVLSILVLLLVNKMVALIMFIWCVIVLSILFPMASKLNQLANEAAESKHKIIGLFSDNITNIFSLFYFSKRKQEAKRADLLMGHDFIPRHVAVEKYNFKFQVVGSLLYWVMLISVLLFMISLRMKGDISTGDFLFVMLTTIFISFDFWMLITSLCDLMKEMGDLKSSFSILSTPHIVVDDPNAKDIQRIKGNVEFKQVSFAYDKEKPVFVDLSLSIKAGEKIGIIGHSGAGKSTLVSLLLKNFKPTAGSILLDAQNITEITSDSLREQIALIPQDIMLFHRSVGDNIGYAKENATLQDIKEAAKMANIDDFIESLANKYDTLVGERGVKLSGGQRQRIAIARAMLKNAPIIILDEATSSLDSITEQQIQQAINLILEKNSSTVIAIAHRLSTIRHMDRIVVMDQGKIIEEGSFNQLMSNSNGYFKTLWDAQVNGMVL
jgi:ATP-binding cassette subfamily B protein